MAFSYRLRSYENDTSLDRLEDIDAIEAESTIGPNSSPPMCPLNEDGDIPDDLYAQLIGADLPEDDGDDPDFILGQKGPPKFTDDQKALACLKYLGNFSRFSLKSFIMTIFQSQDPLVKVYAGRFTENNGFLQLLDIWWEQHGRSPSGTTSALSQWIIERAAKICAREFSFLTDRAYSGPYQIDAAALRISSKNFSVDHIKAFKLEKLTACYDRTLPSFQRILKSVIDKGPHEPGSTRRNPVNVSGCFNYQLVAWILTFLL